MREGTHQGDRHHRIAGRVIVEDQTPVEGPVYATGTNHLVEQVHNHLRDSSEVRSTPILEVARVISLHIGCPVLQRLLLGGSGFSPILGGQPDSSQTPQTGQDNSRDTEGAGLVDPPTGQGYRTGSEEGGTG